MLVFQCYIYLKHTPFVTDLHLSAYPQTTYILGIRSMVVGHVFPGLEVYGNKLVDYSFGSKVYKSVDWYAGIRTISSLSKVKFLQHPTDFLNDILITWRRALGRLAITNWNPEGKDAMILRMANCAPYGASVRPKGWYCRFESLCPWCWARTHMEVSKKLNCLMASCARRRGPLYAAVKSICGDVVKPTCSIQLAYGIKESCKPYFSNKDGPFDLDTYFIRGTVLRSQTMHSLQPIGARHMVTAEPVTLITKRTGEHLPYWRLRSRMLSFLPRNNPLPMCDYPTFHTNFNSTKEEVALAVGYTFRYPSGYLLEQPNMMAELLEVRARGYRLSESYGTLRG